ncbi:GerW family sporulation protein [Skermanella pratensis]|uniref:GerW family sporulation protein n=1 Tax=Skermanella pratensis TaxID=2233999 RepID=UPI0013011177|nr:spore germination protein GerW family protein [Skermanella pratensis]
MLTNLFMPDPVQGLLVSTLQEFQKILGKGVAGTPIQVGDTTLVPIYVTTFGVGAGGGSIFGEACGGGGGGGVVPCAVVVVRPDRVEIQHLQSEFVALATKAHSDVASELSNAYRRDKSSAAATQPTTEPVPAPAPAAPASTVVAVAPLD